MGERLRALQARCLLAAELKQSLVGFEFIPRTCVRSTEAREPRVTASWKVQETPCRLRSRVLTLRGLLRWEPFHKWKLKFTLRKQLPGKVRPLWTGEDPLSQAISH